MDKSSIVAGWLFVNLLLVGVYDLVVSLLDGPANTVSAVIGRWAQKYPPLVIFSGIVIGHLFWPQRIPEAKVVDNGP